MTAIPEMKISALAPWFGGKRTLAPRIVAELGPHSAYWEPFCGGLSVLLAKPESSHETVNDLHGDLINLARMIADEVQAPYLYGRLSRVLFDEKRREDSLVALGETDDPADRAFHYFIASWFGRNGFSGTDGCEKSSFAVRWTPGGGHGGQRFTSAVESIPAWHHRLRRVTILQRDGFEVLSRVDDHPKVVIYCDPPYIIKTGKYTHDFSDGRGMFADDHSRLAKECGRFQNARVVVSYYRHPRLEELYPLDRWTHIDCTMAKGLHNAGQRGKASSEAPEVLIVNGPAFGGAA